MTAAVQTTTATVHYGVQSTSVQFNKLYFIFMYYFVTILRK